MSGSADKLTGADRDVLKYRLEDEYLINARKLVADLLQTRKLEEATGGRANYDEMTDQEVAVWYNNHVIYPDKVRLNCYYYHHYLFVKDIQMIVCTVLGKKMRYAGKRFRVLIDESKVK